MSETTAADKSHGGFEIPPEYISVFKDFIEIRQPLNPIGWLCPRCGKVNAPDVKQCDCKPPQLPHTVVGPKETK
jgi:hypothetical protein